MSIEDHPLQSHSSPSGSFEPVWTLEIQAFPGDVNQILDAVMEVHPMSYGRYERNASVSAVGAETARPGQGSTTAAHAKDFESSSVETYAIVEIKISIERDLDALTAVVDAIRFVHPYEEPVIFLREDWASRAAYDPTNENPNRWWNNGRGLPDRTSI